MTTNDSKRFMCVTVTQHPHTYLKSKAGQSDAPGNETIKAEQEKIFPIDRIVLSGMPDVYGKYEQDYKIALTYPPQAGDKKTWYVYSGHVEVFIPPNREKTAYLLLPRTDQGAFLKQGMGPRETMGSENFFHLHGGDGRYLKSFRPAEDSDHYAIELKEPLNGKVNWYVLKDEVEIWLEWQGEKATFPGP